MERRQIRPDKRTGRKAKCEQDHGLALGARGPDTGEDPPGSEYGRLECRNAGKMVQRKICHSSATDPGQMFASKKGMRKGKLFSTACDLRFANDLKKRE